MVVVRRSQFELKSTQDRAHILEGLLIINSIDEVIETIKKRVPRPPKPILFSTSLRNRHSHLDITRKLAALERQNRMNMPS